MDARIHFIVSCIVSLCLFCIGFGVFVYTYGMFEPAITFLLFMLPFAAAYIVPLFAFRFFIPAKCPECKGLAVLQKKNGFYMYDCRSCGHEYQTGIGFGSGERER